MDEDKLFKKLEEIVKQLEALNLFLQEKISYMEDVDSALLRLEMGLNGNVTEEMFGED